MDNGHNLKLSAAELDAALARAQNISNPNLLDNWYFGNPVDQRGGYVVPPGTAYYSDMYCTNQVGTTNSYVGVVKTPSGWTITVSGTVYFVLYANLVRGYIGQGSYSIDRWILQYDTNLELVGDAVRMSGKWDLKQILERTLPNGTYTASVLYKNAEVANDFYIYLDDSNGVPIFGSNTKETAGLLSYTFTVSGNDINRVRLAMQDNSGNSKVDILAVKLELGSQQTLAHQDENGNWVLNEIPNYTEELAKCQRYFVNLNPGYGSYFTVGSGYVVSETVAEIVAPIPTTMRAFPVVVTNGFAISAGSALWAEDTIVNNCSSGSVNLHCTISGGTAGHPCFAYGGDENYVWLDANL